MTFDPCAIEARLESIAEHLGECRAAAATAADGDPGALAEFSRELDAIAHEVAQLKAAASPPTLGA